MSSSAMLSKLARLRSSRREADDKVEGDRSSLGCDCRMISLNNSDMLTIFWQ